jgi:hypothetical protein
MNHHESTGERKLKTMKMSGVAQDGCAFVVKMTGKSLDY